MQPKLSLLNLPSKGVLPLTGPYGVCTDLPTYIPLHSTNPEQEFTMDDTNPLVRKLQWQKQQQKVNKTPAKGSGTSRKRKCAPEGTSPADKAEGRSSPATAANGSPAQGAAARASGCVDHTKKTYTAAQLSRMHKNPLQQILKAYGATFSGIKQDLVERITQAQSRRRDRVIVIDDDGKSVTPQQPSAAAEQEGDVAAADDDEDADQQMMEADQDSESEAEEDGFERESI